MKLHYIIIRHHNHLEYSWVGWDYLCFPADCNWIEKHYFCFIPVIWWWMTWHQKQYWHIIITCQVCTLSLNMIHNINCSFLVHSAGVQCQWDIGYSQKQHQQFSFPPVPTDTLQDTLTWGLFFTQMMLREAAKTETTIAHCQRDHRENKPEFFMTKEAEEK